MISKTSAKRIAVSAATVALSALLCVGMVGCNPKEPVPDPADYYQESLVQPYTGKTAWESANSNFEKDYATQKALREEGAKLNVQLAEEGMVLMKNANGALPLGKGAGLSLFGYRSYSLLSGGGGSGAGRPGVYGIEMSTLLTSFDEAGFKVNDKLTALYDGKSEELASSELDSVKTSFSSFGDAAIVTISRAGSEGKDLATHDAPGNEDTSKHVLELNDAEIELVKYVKKNFSKVIVLINSANCFEMGELNADKTDSNLGVDAILWIGQTGNDGARAVGRILSGTVSPSGHTVDTWERDFTKGPTYTNIGDLSQNYNKDGTRSNNNLYVNGSIAYGADGETYHSVEYREGIYLGYKYYETVADDMNAANDGSGDKWYEENVVYPFGYGLSYTTFEWELAEDIAPTATIAAANSTVTLKVKVTNTGDVAGKDVVQLYCTPPYTAGKIEKPAKMLCAFAKTKELAPGASDTVTLTFEPYYAASYDYRDANKNGFTGYELEKGDYILSVSRNAHEAVGEIVCNLAADVFYSEDPVTDNTVENRYTGREGHTDSDYQLSTVLSRSDWEGSWPTVPSDEEKALSEEMLEEFLDDEPNNPNDYSGEALPDFESGGTSTLRELLPDEAPEPSASPIIAYKDDVWEKLLDQCSASELAKLINEGCYSTQPVESIGLPATQHGDGPAGFTYFLNKNAVFGTCHYCSEPVMASTFNTELMEELGNTIGEEGFWGNDKTGQPYSSIYAPGVNIHRSMFGGRNAEYFSEDPFLSGMMAAAEIRGCQEMGVVCMVKHFAANEQETHRARYGDVSWVTEQALREIYLRPFEIAVKEGQSRGLMTSFNRIGLKWTGGDYRLLTEILRDEWGFKGTVICDFNTHPEYMFSRQMAYAGGDLNLANTPVAWVDETDVGDLIVLRQCAKNVIFTFANSNAMNGEVIGYRMPDWQIVVLIVDAAIVLLLAAWGVAGMLLAKKKQTRNDE